MPDRIEVHFCFDQHIHVEFSIDDPFLIKERACNRLSERINNHTAATAQYMGLPVKIFDARQVIWIHIFGDILVATQYKTPAFACDMPHGGLPGITLIGGGGQVNSYTLLIHGKTCQGHIILPANKPADNPDFGTKGGKRAAIAFCPDNPFGSRRLDFPVLTQQFPVRPDIK